VLDADLVSDNIIEIRYEYTDNFIKPDAKTNVVIAAFTTAYARLSFTACWTCWTANQMNPNLPWATISAN
jgi:hypothetical protein